MMKNAYSLLLAGSFTLLAGTVLAQDAATKPHVPLQKTVGQVSQQAPVASLLVVNADGVTVMFIHWILVASPARNLRGEIEIMRSRPAGIPRSGDAR